MWTAASASDSQASPKPASSKASPYAGGCGAERGCSVNHAVFDQLQQMRLAVARVLEEVRANDVRQDNMDRRFAEVAAQLQVVRHEQHEHTQQLDQLQAVVGERGMVEALNTRMLQLESSQKHALQASLRALQRWEDQDEWDACCDQIGGGGRGGVGPKVSGDVADGMGGTGDTARSVAEAQAEQSISKLQEQVKELQAQLDAINSSKGVEDPVGAHDKKLERSEPEPPPLDSEALSEWTAMVKGIEDEFRRRMQELQSTLDQKVLVQLKEVEYQVPDFLHRLNHSDQLLQDQFAKSKELEVLIGMLRTNFQGHEQRLMSLVDRFDRMPAASAPPPGPPLQTQHLSLSAGGCGPSTPPAPVLREQARPPNGATMGVAAAVTSRQGAVLPRQAPKQAIKETTENSDELRSCELVEFS